MQAEETAKGAQAEAAKGLWSREVDEIVEKKTTSSMPGCVRKCGNAFGATEGGI